MMVSTVHANGGVIIGGIASTHDNCTAESTKLTKLDYGVIIGGLTGVIIGGLTGVIIGGLNYETPTQNCGVIIGG